MTATFLVAGTLAYMVPTFLIAAPWHLKIFKNYYDDLEVYRENLLMPLGILSMLMQGVVYAWLYAQLFGGGPVLANGMKFALLTGLIGYSYHVLPIAAKHRMRSVAGFIKIETAFVVIQYLVAGPAIALAWHWTNG